MIKLPNKYIIITITCILYLIILFCINVIENIEKTKQTDLIKSLNADLKVWKTKDSLNCAKIQVIKTQRIKDFITLQTNDSIIKELQQTVKKFKKKLKKQGNVTIIKNVTDINTLSKTKVIFKDTIKNNKKHYIFPEYKSNFNLNNWVFGNIIANKNNTAITLKIKNSYSVIIGKENQGFLKRSKPFVEVINKNPFTETKSLRTYEVTMPKKKRFNVGPVIGAGFGGNGKFQAFVGIGIQYSIIEF